MPLSPTALFTDVDEVWDYLCVAPDDRLENNSVMERWINMASAFMEALLNRPCLPRDIVEQLDGNNTRSIYVRESPLISVISVRVWDNNFQLFDDISVDQTNGPNKQLDWEPGRGKLTLLSDAPIGRWRPGIRNVEINYRAGHAGMDLAVLQEAALEMIAVRWHELHKNPLQQSRSDANGTLSTFARADFDELPWMMKQTVMHYRKRAF